MGSAPLAPPAPSVPSAPPADPTTAGVEETLRLLGVTVVPPLRLRRLEGGYSWRTYEVLDASGDALILRVAPRGGTVEPYDPRIEQRALEAVAGVVPAPAVLGVRDQPWPLGGAAIVESRAPGRVLRLSQVARASDRAAYCAAFATTLATLHRNGDAGALGGAGTVSAALRAELELMVERYHRAASSCRPGFEVGLRWLLTHLPESVERPVFCHGDYRFANVTWSGPGRIGAVLDWERAWCGDPMADVGFTRLYSGWCAVAGAAVGDYERVAGRRVDEERVRYGVRFERVRSYTASLSGSRAYADGRSDDPRLPALGTAGERGMWGLVEWLAEGPLRPLPTAWSLPAADPAELGATTRDARELYAASGGLAATGGAWALPALRRLGRAWTAPAPGADERAS